MSTTVEQSDLVEADPDPSADSGRKSRRVNRGLVLTIGLAVAAAASIAAGIVVFSFQHHANTVTFAPHETSAIASVAPSKVTPQEEQQDQQRAQHASSTPSSAPDASPPPDAGDASGAGAKPDVSPTPTFEERERSIEQDAELARFQKREDQIGQAVDADLVAADSASAAVNPSSNGAGSGIAPNGGGSGTGNGAPASGFNGTGAAPTGAGAPGGVLPITGAPAGAPVDPPPSFAGGPAGDGRDDRGSAADPGEPANATPPGAALRGRVLDATQSPFAIREGDTLDVQLLPNIDTDRPGLVRFEFDTNVTDSDNGALILIPRGTIALATSSGILGERALALAPTKMLLNGHWVDFPGATLDNDGNNGLLGHRNTHMWPTFFLTAIAGGLSGLSNVVAGGVGSVTITNQSRPPVMQEVLGGAGTAGLGLASDMANRAAQRPVTISVPQATLAKLQPYKDIPLLPYCNPKVPGSAECKALRYLQDLSLQGATP